MKIICLIVVLIEITKKVHSLQCHVNKLGTKPTPTDCEASKEHFCTYDEMKVGKVARTCMPKGNEKAGCKKTTNGEFVTKICFCATDNCNKDLDTCLKESCTTTDPKSRQMTDKTNGTEECPTKCQETVKNDTKTTEDNAAATSQQGQNPTQGNASGTTKDDQNPTDDTAAATGEEIKQSTGDGAEPTAENVETTNGTATSGNQRVVESNQLVVVLWILVTLIFKSLY